MATESLKIVIGADISSATAAFKNLGDTLSAAGQDAATAFSGASTAVTNFGNSTKAIGRAPLQDINAYKAAVNSLKDSLRTGVAPAVTFTKAVKDIPPAANAAASALKKIPAGANAAGFALTNVGRVAQDLPFGFIGIQNNLNPLLESFQRLKQETGSTGGALKALGSSLIGPAGIGLALSVVSSAFVIFQNGISGFNKKSKEAKESADELKKAIKDIGDITADAAGSVQGEIATVNALAASVADSNKPYAERKRALDELKEINKNYFGDLKLEDAATGKLANTVNEYSKALVNSAISKKFADEISNVAIASFKAEQQLAKSKEELTKKQLELNKANARANLQVVGAQGVAKTSDQRKAESALTDARLAAIESQKTANQLTEQRTKLNEGLNKSLQEGLKIPPLETPGGDKKSEDALKKRIDALKTLREEVGLTNKQQIELVQLEVQLTQRDGVKLGFTKEEINDRVQALIDKAFSSTGNEFVNSRGTISVGGEIDFSKVKIVKPEIEPIDIAGAVKAEEIPADAFDGVINSIRSGAARAQGALEDARDGIASIAASIQDAIVSAFDGLGAALGDALSGGGFSGVLAKFGETVLKIIGGVLQDIGKQIVVASKLVATLKKVLSSVGLGAASLVVGLALVALGGVLKNIKFNTPQFEKGGIASGPRSGYLATLHGTELVIPMNKIDKRPAASTGLQGGASGMVILQPSLSIDGRSIKVMLNRIDRTDNRIF